jgi:hypothetical protein
LRLLGTREHLVAYHPDGLKEGRGLRFRIKHSAIESVDETTDSATVRIYCAGSHGVCTHDLDLDWLVSDNVIARLRASIAGVSG